MQVPLTIMFRRLNQREWLRGLAVTTLFAALFAIAALLLPIGANYFSDQIARYYLNHHFEYLIAVCLSLATLLWRYGYLIFGWIARELTSTPAATFDSLGVSAWTTTGRQHMSWNDIRYVELRRPSSYEERRFTLISLEGQRAVSDRGFAPKIVLDSDTMDFDAHDVVQFIKSKRPDLIDKL